MTYIMQMCDSNPFRRMPRPVILQKRGIPVMMTSATAATAGYGKAQMLNRPAIKTEQLQYECNTWKRLLGFMMDENVCLKNRLSEVLRERFGKELLEAMENFQSRFIEEDESISLLRNDIADIDKLLQREKNSDGSLPAKANKKIKELRNNILLSCAKFSKLQSDFHAFLQEHL